MIQVEQASRWYGQVIGLNDVTCSFGPGVTALLGQNGAGKSTLIKLITGQLRPTTGHVKVFGEQPFANANVARHLGYCPETDSFYEEMTGRQFVTLMARMSGVEAPKAGSVAGAAIETVGMADRADTRIAGYSKGMRQRIKLAQAMAHGPRALVLDEPLNGLDPVGRRQMQDLLRDIGARGTCVIISSHILHEVEQMTHNIVLLHRGRLMAVGDIQKIRSLIDRHPHRIRIKMGNARTFAQRILTLPSVLSLQFNRQDADQMEVETVSPDEFYSQVSELVLETGTEFGEFSSPDNNLEAVFNYLVKG
ncbi:MAG: ABC transporter ATP-binding protein [Fimbriimonadales bacterium]